MGVWSNSKRIYWKNCDVSGVNCQKAVDKFAEKVEYSLFLKKLDI